MSDQARFRDFYDIFLILEKHQLNLDEITGYIRRKEIRQPISKKNIIKNWEITKDKKENEKKIIFYSQSVEDQQVQEMIHNMPFNEIT